MYEWGALPPAGPCSTSFPGPCSVAGLVPMLLAHGHRAILTIERVPQLRQGARAGAELLGQAQLLSAKLLRAERALSPDIPRESVPLFADATAGLLRRGRSPRRGLLAAAASRPAPDELAAAARALRPLPTVRPAPARSRLARAPWAV